MNQMPTSCEKKEAAIRLQKFFWKIVGVSGVAEEMECIFGLLLIANDTDIVCILFFNDLFGRAENFHCFLLTRFNLLKSFLFLHEEFFTFLLIRMMRAELAGRLVLNYNFDHIFIQAIKNSANIVFC